MIAPCRHRAREMSRSTPTSSYSRRWRHPTKVEEHPTNIRKCCSSEQSGRLSLRVCGKMSRPRADCTVQNASPLGGGGSRRLTERAFRTARSSSALSPAPRELSQRESLEGTASYRRRGGGYRAAECLRMPFKRAIRESPLRVCGEIPHCRAAKCLQMFCQRRNQSPVSELSS